MSPSLNILESEWRVQYAALRQALAKSETEQSNGERKSYGHDIVLDDEDLTARSGSDDVWDIFSDDEQDAHYNSDNSESVTAYSNGRPKSAYSYRQEWLGSKCFAFASGKPGLDAEELQRQLSSMLASDLIGLLVRLLCYHRLTYFYRR